MASRVASNPEYMTKVQVARTLGLSTATVDNLISRGELVSRRSYPGIQARYLMSDVMALKARYEEPAVQTQTA